MNKDTLKNSLGWGAALWFLGFATSMIFFPFVPVKYLGIPVLILIIPAMYIASLKIFKEKVRNLNYALLIGISWLLVALLADYYLLVKSFQIQNYYDADLAIYYVATFFIPLIVWYRKKPNKKP